MKQRLRQIVAILMLGLVFAPNLEKVLHHHHEYQGCTAKHEKHFHQKFERCEICLFQTTVYVEPARFQVASVLGAWLPVSNSYHNVFLDDYVLLGRRDRAPPKFELS